MGLTYKGIELFDSKMNFLRRLTTANGHKDVTLDNGEEIMVWTNSNEDPLILWSYPNGIVKIRLSDGRQTGLLALGWSPKGGPLSMSVSICCPEGKNFALVTTYGQDSGVPYANTIIALPFDGSAPKIIAHHQSDISTYEGQPHAVGSGNQFLFDSREEGRNVVYLGTL